MTDQADALTAAAIEAGCTLRDLSGAIRAARIDPATEVTPDALPSARSVVGELVVERAVMALRLATLEAEIELQARIIARLTDALEHLEGKTVHELAVLFAPRKRGGQPAFAAARALDVRAQ